MEFGNEPELEKGCNSVLVKAEPISPPAAGFPYANVVNRTNVVRFRKEHNTLFNNLSEWTGTSPFSKYPTNIYSLTFRTRGFYNKEIDQNCFEKIGYPATIGVFLGAVQGLWNQVLVFPAGHEPISVRAADWSWRIVSGGSIGAVIGISTCALAASSPYLKKNDDLAFLGAGMIGGILTGVNSRAWSIAKCSRHAFALGALWMLTNKSWKYGYRPFLYNDFGSDLDYRINHIPKADGRY